MILFKKVIVSIQQSFLFRLVKLLLIRIIPKEKYKKLQNFYKERLLKVSAQTVNQAKVNKIHGKVYGINLSSYYIKGVKGCGLGEAALNTVKAIKTQDIPYTINDYGGNIKKRVIDVKQEVFSKDNPYFCNLLSINPELLDYFLIKAKKNYLINKYNIGIWYWEFPSIPEEWRGYFDYYNELWVATNFVQNNISSKSTLPVVKIPMVIDLRDDLGVKRVNFDLKDTDFIFLYIFDFGSVMMRKNPIGAVKSFQKAFTKDDNACLIIKTSYSKHFKRELSILEETIDDWENIKLIDRYFTKNTINSLIRLSDCYVSLHRAEGFGLGIAEAMYYGKPVIATAYSGNMEFTNENNSYLVKYNLVEVDDNYGLIKKGNVWAEPDIDHAAHLMRYVYENRDAARIVGANGKDFIDHNHNAHVVGEMIKRRLDYAYKNINGN